MKLFLVRHAESKRNVEMKSDIDPGLTDIGKEQARRIGLYFSRMSINHVYVSPLKRTRETWKEIRPFLKKVPVTVNRSIVEHSLGIYAEKGVDDWSAYARGARDAKIPFVDFKPKRGESLQHAFLRAKTFYHFLLKKHSKDSVLIVSHGTFMKYLIMHLLGLPIDEGKYWQLSNASVSTFEIDIRGIVKKFHINDYRHVILGSQFL